MEFERSIYLPLHNGKAPYWLLNRMKRLAKPIIALIIEEYGEKEFFNRISNPIFFQSLSNVLGFDWNSSGSTTVLTGVLKSVLNTDDFNIRIAGGKGSNALKTPEEIRRFSDEIGLRSDDAEKLVKVSRIAAKVDNSAIQDGYDIYHHTVIFSKKYFTLIQQGMNAEIRIARRYHWKVCKSLQSVEEVHSGIMAEKKEKEVINLVSKLSRDSRGVILDIVNDRSFERDYRKLLSIAKFGKKLYVPKKINWKAVEEAYNLQPEKFEDLLLIKGFGKAALRALALISDLIYNVEYDKQDPAKYCFALGGKDGVPYPINKDVYNDVISFMEDVIKQSDLSNFEKKESLKKLLSLNRFCKFIKYKV